MAGWFWASLGVVLYTYLGYPALLVVLAQFRSERRVDSSKLPTLTVLIPAHNEQVSLEEKLTNTLSLDYPAERLQIIVATDGSTDRTPDIVREFESRRVELSHRTERRGKSAALNNAMDRAQGDIVVLSDANTVLDRDCLRQLVAPFVDPNVGMVSGAKHIRKGDGGLGESEGLYWKYESLIKSREARLGSCLGVSGELVALRAELFEPIPDGVVNDDTYLLMRTLASGARVDYAPKARSFERVSATQDDESERRARMVAGRLDVIFRHSAMPLDRPLLVWQFVSHKVLRALLPLAMISMALASLGAVFLGRKPPSPTMRRLLAGQAAFYSLAAAGARLERHRWSDNKPLAKLFIYLPAFIVRSNVAALRGLARFILRRQSPIWDRAARPMTTEPER